MAGKPSFVQVDRPHDVLRRHVDDRDLRVILNADVEQVAAGCVGRASRRSKPEAPYDERRSAARRAARARPRTVARHLSAVFTMNSPCSMLLTMIVPLLKNG